MTRLLNKITSFARYSISFFLVHPLWEGRRHLPFLRFLRLQIIFALGETNICLPWFTGLWLPICKGDSGLTGNYYLGLHEFRDMAFTAQLLKPGDLFVDIGANIGSYSLIASGLCKAQSIAFEPAPPLTKSYKKLLKQIAYVILYLLGHMHYLALVKMLLQMHYGSQLIEIQSIHL